MALTLENLIKETSPITNDKLGVGNKTSELGMIPEDWEIKLLGDVVYFLDGKRRPIKDSDRAKIRGIFPYYGASGIIDYVNDYLFDEELILLGEDGENILSRNCRLVFKISGKAWVNNHAHVLKPTSDIDINYLTEYLESLDYEKYNTGTAQPKLNKKVCWSIPLKIPPLKEQQAIAAALSDIDSLINSLNQLITKKRNLKLAAMQQLLTGMERLPGFSEDWKIRRIEEIADIDPENLDKNTSPGYSFKYISLEDVDKGVLKGCAEQIFYQAPSRARRKIRKNDILISTVRPNLKSHLLIRNDVCNMICSTGFSVLRCKSAYANPAFVYAHFFASVIDRQIESLLTGSNYPAINSKDLRALKIPIPSLAEQKSIGGVLSDMDNELSALEQQLDKTRNLKQGLMQELLTGRIRLT